MKGPKIIVLPPGPKSKKLIERWKKCSPASVDYPSFSEADNIYVKDVDGNIFMNFADLTVNVGHRNPDVITAVKKQLNKSGMSKIRGPSELRIDLIEKIKEIVTPNLSKGKFEFCNSGSEAIEFSIKLARAYTGRSLLIAYLGAHHGFSMGALSLTADRSENRRFCLPMVPGIIHIPYPYCYRCPFSQEYPHCELFCLEHLKYVFDTLAHPNETAAIFIEPIQQVAGVIPPPKDYFSKLQKLCENNKILIIDDEVATGFGRTGKMFGIEHWNLDPEIMLFGKAFANGAPLAGIIAIKEIMDKESEFPMIHGTFSGSLISCVSALAVIKQIQEKRLVTNSAEIGEYILKRLRELAEEHEMIGDVRGMGLMIGIELVKNRENKIPATKETEKIVKETLKRGLLIVRVGTYKQVLRLTPPLTISKEEADKAIEILEHTIKDM